MIRPLEHASVLTVVMATIALLVILNGLAAWIWSPRDQVLSEPVPDHTWVIGGVHISKQDVGTFAVTLGCVARALGLLPLHEARPRDARRRVNPAAARLLGVRTSWLLALGWGFAAVLGAVSGMMVAPTVFLTPNMMQAVLIYAFAAAVLGGLESPSARSSAGWGSAICSTCSARTSTRSTPELRLPVALAILLVVLLLRPAGLFGRVVVRRVWSPPRRPSASPRWCSR